MKIIYKKAIYKWKYGEVYVLPLRIEPKTPLRGAYIVIKNLCPPPDNRIYTCPYKEGEIIPFGLSLKLSDKLITENFLENYIPYVWEGGLFKDTTSGWFKQIDDISEQRVQVRQFGSCSGSFYYISNYKLAKLIDFKLQNISSIKLIIPKLIYFLHSRTVLHLVNETEHDVTYGNLKNGTKNSWLKIKLTELLQEASKYDNGCLIKDN